MKPRGCGVHQSLRGEAAAVVKQAVELARRRGHAQVTSLHVATTMLSSSTGQLRAACSQSNSHPHQCKALELCFSVALNRLPSSSSSPTAAAVIGRGYHPSFSNSLVAAFKRAQAHHRRGAVESQQQSVISRIELEQLIISILDDPSVSRVMKEAGFCSSRIKSNVEKVAFLEMGSQKSKENKISNSNLTIPCTAIKRNEVYSIIETLITIRKRRSYVIVGECILKLEETIKELMNFVDTEEVPEDFKNVKFVSIPPLHSFCDLDGDLGRRKMWELSNLVQGLAGKGVVLYLGDLSWVSHYNINMDQQNDYYRNCVEYMIMEIGRLVSDLGENARFWLMGIGTFQTYMRCKNGCRPLESLWGLHPITIPVDSLGLSLISRSGNEVLDEIHSTKCSTKFPAGPETLSFSQTFPFASSNSSYFSTDKQSVHQRWECNTFPSINSLSLSEFMETPLKSSVGNGSPEIASSRRRSEKQRNGAVSCHVELDLNARLDDETLENPNGNESGILGSV